VISRMEELRSAPIDRRLAETLLDLHGEKTPVIKTHQELALELGVSRETVSRHLKCFETLGWVRLGRGAIEIRSPETLARIAER